MLMESEIMVIIRLQNKKKIMSDDCDKYYVNLTLSNWRDGIRLHFNNHLQVRFSLKGLKSLPKFTYELLKNKWVERQGWGSFLTSTGSTLGRPNRLLRDCCGTLFYGIEVSECFQGNKLGQIMPGTFWTVFNRLQGL